MATPLMTTYEYTRMKLANAFASKVAKPILDKADKAIHEPLASLTLLAAVPENERTHGMTCNVLNAFYMHVSSAYTGGETSPDVIVCDAGVGYWVLFATALPGAIIAADVTYDPAVSGLTAVEVQAAIDEIVAGTLAKAADRIRNSTDTAQETASGVELLLAFEDAELVGNVTVDVANQVFTIATTGVYSIVYEGTFAGDAGGTIRELKLYTGDACLDANDAAPDSTNPVFVAGSTSRYLAAASTVSVKALQDCTAALNVTAGRIVIQRIQ